MPFPPRQDDGRTTAGFFLLNIPGLEYTFPGMRLVAIYECLCDETRLRILNLLLRQPMRVWQLQKILRAPQVKISKHLAYLRQRQMVESFRHGNEVVYHLPRKQSRELVRHLKCLQDCCRENSAFREDLRRRHFPACTAPAASPR